VHLVWDAALLCRTHHVHVHAAAAALKQVLGEIVVRRRHARVHDGCLVADSRRKQHVVLQLLQRHPGLLGSLACRRGARAGRL
jgi:hypothetical protein